uniref:Uncharacterized protein n=1 Tax=Caenorhabditis tropicalis TaxID=1561998 RepID=A0A1I7U832_9PELO
MESSFQRKLNAQNEKFAEELRKMKEKRRRLNEEAEEEMRQFRKESAMRIQIFLNCLHLKLRWEEQENEWSDWLKCSRDPVIKVKIKLMEFEENRRNEDDEEEMKSEVMFLHKNIQISYDKLVDNFEKLVMLSEKYEDKLFLKIIQKSISTVATKLCILMDELDDFEVELTLLI